MFFMLAAIDELVPFVLFSLPWFMAVFEIRRGLTRGELREYHRRDYSEDDHGRPSRYCRRSEEPKTFWCLFAFYVIVTVLIPIGMVYAITHQPEPPPQNPG